MTNLFKIKNIPEVIALEKEVNKFNKKVDKIERNQKSKNWKNAIKRRRRYF